MPRRVLRSSVEGTAIAAVVLTLLAGIGLGSCEMKPVVRPIADSIEIDREWTELRPDPPLHVSRQTQVISITVPDPARWTLRPATASFLMPDGTPIKIDVELIASDGARFVLDQVGVGTGLRFSRLRPSADATSTLPGGAELTAVRIRSDVPLRGGPVEWICATNY